MADNSDFGYGEWELDIARFVLYIFDAITETVEWL